jgi:hypothetical protein
MTMEPIRSLLVYTRCTFWISSSLKVVLIDTEIFPSLSHSQSSPTFYESAADDDLFAQDSLRVRSNLTLNYGLR